MSMLNWRRNPDVEVEIEQIESEIEQLRKENERLAELNAKIDALWLSSSTNSPPMPPASSDSPT